MTRSASGARLNSAMEMHDSALISLDREAGVLTLHLSAYMHQSDGVPGKDPGTGWTQAVDVTIADGQVQGPMATFPFGLVEGRLKVGGQVYEGLVPLPFEGDGPIAIELHGGGGTLNIVGSSIRIQTQGQPKLIERFPRGMRRDDR